MTYLLAFFMMTSLIASPQSEPPMTNTLHQTIPANPFVIPAHKVKELTQAFNLEVEELLQLLIPIAKTYALPPISNYQVGVAALGKSGSIYLGVNLEFLGVPLNTCIHAEQFLITNARSHGETELVKIALSAAPCGHCRQFLNEMGSDLQILTPNTPAQTLSNLLPNAFGPQDLGLTGNLLSSTDKSDLTTKCLFAQALEAARASYAPYSHSKSGVAIQTHDGKTYTGSYLENAAFNPSVSPLQAALVSLVADQRNYTEIKEVVLFEQSSPKISQEMITREILKSIAPDARFRVENREF